MIGLFGGSFNPVHNAHLAMADEVAYRLDLEKIIFVVSADPPHKEKSTLLPFADRIAMVKRATNRNSRFAVSDIEKMREGKSYTIDTINYFRDESGEEPVFLVGWDAFLDMQNWHKAEELITTCNIAVMDREGEQREPLADVITKLLKTVGGKHDFKIVEPSAGENEKILFDKNRSFITSLPVPRLDISSSDIRRRLETGEPVRYLVPESVMEFIGGKSE